MSERSTIISKVWGMCNPLRDDGLSYGDYLEQLTYLIFLKMSDEYAKPPYKRQTGIPDGFGWEDMCLLKGAELEEGIRPCAFRLCVAHRGMTNFLPGPPRSAPGPARRR